MDLDYKITTSAELAGAEAAADSLERQIGKAKALKQDYSALDAQLKTARQSLDEYKTATAAQTEQADELKRANEQLADSVHTVTKGEIEAAEVGGESMGGLSLKKRELLEATRSLTREYPMLGEVMRAAFNPAALAIFGIIGGIEIWISRIKNLTEAYGGLELPSFGDHIKDAENIATAYDGIEKAVEGADTQFESAAGIFERQSRAINAQLSATKQLITAQKQKAEADLDLDRESGRIGPTMYAARKNIIEQGYNDQTTAAETDARNAELQAKKDEAARLFNAAKADAAKAAAMNLPESDVMVEANIAEQKDRAAALKKQAETHRAEIDKLQEFQAAQSDESWSNMARQLPAALIYSTQHGALTDPGELIKIRQASANHAEDSARAAEQEAARMEREKAAREKLRKKSEEEAAAGETLYRSNAGEDDPRNVGSVAWQNAQAQTTQHLRDNATTENRIGADEHRINDDLRTITDIASKNTHSPEDSSKSKKAVEDMVAGFQDLQASMKLLADHGDNVSQVRKDIAQFRAEIEQKISQLSYATNFH